MCISIAYIVWNKRKRPWGFNIELLLLYTTLQRLKTIKKTTTYFGHTTVHCYSQTTFKIKTYGLFNYIVRLKVKQNSYELKKFKYELKTFP